MVAGDPPAYAEAVHLLRRFEKYHSKKVIPKKNNCGFSNINVTFSLANYKKIFLNLYIIKVS